MNHIATLRLFDRASLGIKLRLEDWERQHLGKCEECQTVLEIFARQFDKGRPAFWDRHPREAKQSETCRMQSIPNGLVNTQFGVYKSICCGWEIVLREGETFPDCPKHLRLSTIWKPVKADIIRMVPIRMTKSNSAA
jgi:hypothetical protein